MEQEVLRFWPLESKVEAATFWSALGELKLHDLQLDEGPLPLRAFWTPSRHASQPGLLTVSAASLLGASAGVAEDAGPPPAPSSGAGFSVAGNLYVLNTAERILSTDRKAVVQQACQRVWAAIASGEAEHDPHLLQTAVLLAYCDLKQYKYRYWFACPALQPPQPFQLAGAPASLAAALGEAAAAAVAAACSQHATATGLPAWLACLEASTSGGDSSSDGTAPSVTTAALADWALLHAPQGEAAGVAAGGSGGGSREVFLAVADSSNLAENPGWPLRNLLLLAAARWRCRRLRVLCLRERRGRFDAQASLVLDVCLPELPPGFEPTPLGGWEPNERGKQGPRTADLAPAMDPRQLAAAAVQLNLRLMRWRAAPALDVAAIGGVRCLLLGAGTLGCSVARTLLGWGVRHITFVDNSRVAYSNPVRQSLFGFEDCLDGGKPKAAAAADAVQRIFPGASARGVQMSVPMPGHPLSEAEVPQVLRDIAELEALVEAHDVVFLLTDTRESRWLPTLLCAARGRLAINAALGFSGFMVMRHGAPVPQQEEQGEEPSRAGEAATRGLGGEAAPPDEPSSSLDADQAAPVAPAAAGEAPVQATPGQAAEVVAAEDPEEQQQAADPGPPQHAHPAGGMEPAEQPVPGSLPPREAPPAPRLGCYFCNDVVAPLDSTRDRSLDQQCTVARPGLSAIAGSLAVELMASVLAHPLGPAAPVPGGSAGGAALAAAAAAAAKGKQQQQQQAAWSEEDLPLGAPPHMVRGQLSGFSQMCLVGQAFRQCTACSPAVVGEYRRRGADFILEGLLDPRKLEDLTGLTELHRSTEAALQAWGDSEEDEEEGEGEGSKEGGVRYGDVGQGSSQEAGSSRGVGRSAGDDGDEEDWEEL